MIERYDTPEDINDGAETASSKRLEQIFKDYEKLPDGNMIFEKISVETMKIKCPHFKQWLESIEKTAGIFKK
ncbi:MAG: DUF4276 family protein [Elusimicrobiota bacterium]|nr:DUF4276 family protein [Elusimicrobiota bacterium]